MQTVAGSSPSLRSFLNGAPSNYLPKISFGVFPRLVLSGTGLSSLTDILLLISALVLLVGLSKISDKVVLLTASFTVFTTYITISVGHLNLSLTAHFFASVIVHSTKAVLIITKVISLITYATKITVAVIMHSISVIVLLTKIVALVIRKVISVIMHSTKATSVILHSTKVISVIVHSTKLIWIIVHSVIILSTEIVLSALQKRCNV